MAITLNPKVLRARQRLGQRFHGVTAALLGFVAFFTPLTFVFGSVDPVELPKAALLVGLTLLAAIVWAIGWLVLGEVRWRPIPGGWLLAGLAFLTVLSTLFSVGHVGSLIGSQGYVHQTLPFMIAAILYVVLLTQILDDGRDVQIFGAVAASGLGIAGLVGFLQFAGVSPFAWSATSFLITGNAAASFSVLMAVMAVVAIPMIQRGRIGSGIGRLFWTVFGYGGFSLALLGLLASDSIGGWVAAVVGTTVLLTFASLRPLTRSDVILCTVVIAIGVLGMIAPTNGWIGTNINPDLRLDVGTSWSVTRSTVAEFPIIGSGPGTFLNDFVRFRPAEFTASPLSGFRFVKASDEALQSLATMGVLGSLMMVAIIVWILRRLTGESLQLVKREREAWFAQTALVGAWTGLTASLFFVPSTTLTTVMFWIGLGLLAVLTRGSRPLQSWHPTFVRPASVAAVLVVVVAFVVTTTWSVRMMLAERAIAQATEAITARQDLALVVRQLDRAVALNPARGSSYLLRAQALVTKAQLEAQNQTPNVAEANAAIQQAIIDAETAVARENSNPAILEAVADLYKNIGTLIGNTAEQVAGAYDRAAKLEPNNPVHHMSLGQVHYFVAEALSKEEPKDDEAIRRRLIEARAAFETALRIAPDELNASFGLVLVDELAGEGDAAFARLEGLAKLYPMNGGLLVELGQRYVDRNEESQALAMFQRAIDADATLAEPHYQLGLLAERSGDTAAAKQAYQRALSLDPTHAEAKKKLEAISAT